MAAPVVNSLQDIIAQIGAAYKPQQDQIDQSINSNEQAGQGQVAGLNAAKTNAFGDITQAAQNKGMLFGGFTPDAEAHYTGATYLPALAKLQGTIAATRDTLLGKKADIASQANTQGLSVHQQQVKDAQDYTNAQEAAAAAAKQHAADQAFTASENAKNRAASAAEKSAASAPPPLATGLAQLFTGYTSSKQGGTPYYTENTVVPQIMSAYGLSHADALKAAYNFRKSTFGE